MRGSICWVIALVAGLAISVSSQVQPSKNTPARTGKRNPEAGRVPYTATYQETRIRKKPDGGTITNSVVVVEAFDRQGRSMQSTMDFAGPGSLDTLTRTSVRDPVAQSDTDWTVVQPRRSNYPPRQATVTNWPAIREARVPCPEPDRASLPSVGAAQPAKPVLDDPVARVHQALEELRAELRAKPPADELSRTTRKQEDLGTKTIRGMEVHGHRTTTTTTTNANEKGEPSVDISEEWVDTTPGLHLWVLELRDGPREKYRRELVSIKLGEPEPALFQPPAGYEIVNWKPPSCPTPGAPVDNAKSKAGHSATPAQ